MKKYCIMYTNIYSHELHVVMYELEENVETFITNKINSSDYAIKDFRVFMGEELYVERASRRIGITLNLKYRGMS